MEATIEAGRALVLVGPQGCGKSVLARELAAAKGSYCELDALELESGRALWTALEQEPATCIVEGLPRGAEALQRVKSLLSNPETVVPRKDQEPKLIRSPNFIFCTGDPEPLKHLEGRRFHIVHIAPGGAA